MRRLFVLISLAPLLSGCDQQGVIQQTPEGRETGLVIYTDIANGCQYMRLAYHDGIAPRLGRDGKQICN